jgi:hypothetical protein
MVERRDLDRDPGAALAGHCGLRERGARRVRQLIRDVELGGARSVTDGHRDDLDVVETSAPRDLGQARRETRLGLECDDATSASDGAAEPQDEAPLVRADVDRDITRAQRPDERAQLRALVAEPRAEAAVQESDEH